MSLSERFLEHHVEPAHNAFERKGERNLHFLNYLLKFLVQCYKFEWYTIKQGKKCPLDKPERKIERRDRKERERREREKREREKEGEKDKRERERERERERGREG